MENALCMEHGAGDEGCIGPSGKLPCLCQTPKNYAEHAWHHSIHV